MLLWNTKNIEYALGANISDLSMKYWDADERHAFEGDHVLLKQGFSAVIEYMLASLEKAAKSEFNYRTHKRNVDLLYSKLKILDKKLSTTTVKLRGQLIRLAAAELDQRFKNIDSYYRAFKFDVASNCNGDFLNFIIF